MYLLVFCLTIIAPSSGKALAKSESREIQWDSMPVAVSSGFGGAASSKEINKVRDKAKKREAKDRKKYEKQKKKDAKRARKEKKKMEKMMRKMRAQMPVKLVEGVQTSSDKKS